MANASSTANLNALALVEQAAPPSNPDAGKRKLYVATDGTLRWRKSDGTEQVAATNSGTFTGEVQGTDFKATGLTGATAGGRFVGATASGAPVSGTFVIGDFVVARTGSIWMCTAAGTPGTWVSIGGGGGAPTTSKYALGLADASLPNGLVIPNFVGHPDIAPASPNAMDDEFDAGSLDVKWTKVNMAAVVTETYAGSHAIWSAANNSVTIRGAYQACTTGKWRCKLTPGGAWQNNCCAGLWLREASSGKCLTLGVMMNNGWCWRGDRWTSSTAFSSSPLNIPTAGNGPAYLEVELDGTNVIYRVCAHGLGFEQAYTELKAASFTTAPDGIGVFVSGFNDASAFNAAFDWFRKVA